MFSASFFDSIGMSSIECERFPSLIFEEKWTKITFFGFHFLCLKLKAIVYDVCHVSKM